MNMYSINKDGNGEDAPSRSEDFLNYRLNTTQNQRISIADGRRTIASSTSNIVYELNVWTYFAVVVKW